VVARLCFSLETCAQTCWWGLTKAQKIPNSVRLRPRPRGHHHKLGITAPSGWVWRRAVPNIVRMGGQVHLRTVCRGRSLPSGRKVCPRHPRHHAKTRKKGPTSRRTSYPLPPSCPLAHPPPPSLHAMGSATLKKIRRFCWNWCRTRLKTNLVWSPAFSKMPLGTPSLRGLQTTVARGLEYRPVVPRSKSRWQPTGHW
jgi:hypothetical protein